MSHTPASPADPIACSKVIVDLDEVERVLTAIRGIKDFALRLNHACSPEAFILIDRDSGLNLNDIKLSLSSLLPGYSVPELRLLSQPLIKSEGRVDFSSLENQIAPGHTLNMSEEEIIVCDIIASLLLVEPEKITQDSNFFLLGGNSLLLGQLSHRLRKEIGVSVGIAALFRRCTIEGIALLIEEARIKSDLTKSPDSFDGSKLEGFPSVSGTTLQDTESLKPRPRSRYQTNPLVLIVQALPFLFFYPLKSALNCERI